MHIVPAEHFTYLHVRKLPRDGLRGYHELADGTR